MSTQAQINKAKEDLNSLLKSLAGNVEVKIEFDGDLKNNFFKLNENLVKQESFILPEIKAEDDFVQHCRAALDMALGYFLFHDSKNKYYGNDEEEKKFLEDFEKIRLIKKLENTYRGCAYNILEKIEEDVFFASDNLSLLLLNEFFPDEILKNSKNFARNLLDKFPQNIRSQIKILAKNLDNQKQFASEVSRLLTMLRTQESEEENHQEESEKNSENIENKKEEFESFGAENPGENEQEIEENGSEEGGFKEQENIVEEFIEDKSGEAEVEVSKAKAQAPAREEKIEYIKPYKIYSSQFDEVVFPQKLIAKKELEMLYDQLDLKLKNLANISRKMSLKLKKKLMSKKAASSEFNSSRGIINRKKLTQIVLNPNMEDIWINQFEHEYQNTALTILLDNSGSMRGAPIVMSAMACKIIAEILEKFSVKVEIIGFTTVDWKGGRVRKKWEIDGRPMSPGRLTELRHIIYKSFDQSLKKSKINLGLMLREGILKENIDGEALLFARSRLMQQSEERKILMVISDGTPIDDSTLAVNDADILSNHLTQVVNKIEKSKKIETIGIGIGHDTSNYYHNSITIKNLEDLGDVMIQKLCEVL